MIISTGRAAAWGTAIIMTLALAFLRYAFPPQQRSENDRSVNVLRREDFADAEPSMKAADSPQAQLAKIFVGLEDEYRILQSRKSALNTKNPDEVSKFNHDASDYTRRLQQARAQKLQLEAQP